MTMNLAIRDAHENDIREIIELRKQLDDLSAEMLPHLFQSAYLYNEESIRGYLAAVKSRLIVVEEMGGNRLLAYAVLNKEQVEERAIFKKKSMLYVNDFVVREGFRSKGIGKFLFEYIVNYAKELKVDTLELNVFAANKQAVRLYESFGLADQNKRMALKL
jgi:GNAT superfamily N-acetyltransferase